MWRCFPARDSSTGNFSRRSLFTTNNFTCTVHNRVLPSDSVSHGCCWQHRTSPHLDPNGLLPISPSSPPCRGIILPRCCDSYAIFCTFFSVANTLSNAVLVFIVLTCACQFRGVILLSLFSFTLLPVASATGEIFRAAAIALSSFGVRQKNLAGTLLWGKFGSLHVLFLCVHSILVFMTSQCPICGVECAYAPCRGSRGESGLNGSPCKGFTMCTICI